jgi:hypothetical protein
MTDAKTGRRAVLQSVPLLPFAALLARASEATAQGNSPVRVDTKGLTAKIKFEEVIAG